MSDYIELFNPNITPQTEIIPGREKDMSQNNAGGVTFTLDNWKRLERWLILGSDAPTYYQNAKELTKENATIVNDCWAVDPVGTASIITDISINGRAPKQNTAIFALALGAVHPNVQARQQAYAAVKHVCRTASHLFQWVNTCFKLGKGTGSRGFKRVLADWYASRSTEQLAYQAIKYRQRDGFTHKRLIELSNKGAGEDAERKALYSWMRGKDELVDRNKLPDLINAHLVAMRTEKKDQMLELVTRFKLPWEAIPTASLTDPEVWKAVIPHMGLTALIRNLGNMTACGAIGPMNHTEVVERLSNKADIWKSRVHPFSILQALAVYKSGQGVRGSKNWTPVRQIIDALDGAFYVAFKNAEPTGKRIMLALDVSGSMTASIMGSPLSCRDASAALALITMATEHNTMTVGFTSNSGRRSLSRNQAGLTELNISPRQRLDDVVRSISGLPFGGTDCALPMLYALENSIECDAFVIYTDSETWAGKIQPVQALQQYRNKTGINAKCIVVGMTSNGFSIADPNDAGMLDIVGFDANVPALISDFIRN